MACNGGKDAGIVEQITDEMIERGFKVPMLGLPVDDPGEGDKHTAIEIYLAMRSAFLQGPESPPFP